MKKASNSGRRSNAPQTRKRQRRGRPLRLESLEDRTLLSVQFLPGPYVTPANRPDVPLGVLSNFPGTTSSFMEPMLAVNSTGPGNIAVSSADVARITTDAGATFGPPTNFKPPPRYMSDGDTDMKFDGQGRLFWSNLAFVSNGEGVCVTQIDPTTGAGMRSVMADQGPTDDKPFMTIDTNPASPFFDTIYVVWTRFNGTDQIFIARSTDQARTWSPPVQLSNAPSEGLVSFADASVAPNGDVYVAYHSQLLFTAYGNPDGNTGKTFVLRSTDGGLSFTQKNLAFGPGQSDVTFNYQTDVRTIPGTQFITAGSAQPWVLADPARPGNVYVVTADDPTNGAGAPYARTVFARSTDNGATWSFPQVNGSIAPLDGTSFELFPTAAIDRFGDIVVAWYDNRRGQSNNRNDFLLDVFATYSTDGGLTWATPFPVNAANNAFDPDPNAPVYDSGPPPTTRIGEYFGSALFGGTAYLAWNGSRFTGKNPVGQQVWFGSFALSGALSVTGTPGDDTITLRSLADNPDFVEVLVNGQQEYAGLWSALTGITIAPTGGNDTINIEDLPAGIPVTVNLGDGADQVNLSPTAGNLSTLAGTVTINGGSGSDTLVGWGSNNTWTINGSNAGTIADANSAGLVTFTSVQNLTGNGANNRFVFSDGASISGNLDGGSGGTLDYSAYSSSVIVDLQTGTATGVGGSIAHIRNVLGGTGGGAGIYNILVGDGGNTLTGGNGRRNFLIAGSSASTLLGGNDDDILIGGTTVYDTDVASLQAIMAYWSGTSDDYATRVSNLLAGNGVPLLDATTVTGNGGGNTLIGNGGLNLWYGNLALDSYPDYQPDREIFIGV